MVPSETNPVRPQDGAQSNKTQCISDKIFVQLTNFSIIVLHIFGGIVCWSMLQFFQRKCNIELTLFLH